MLYLDDCQFISIKDFGKRWNLLQEGLYKHGSVNWYRGGEDDHFASISYIIDNRDINTPFIQLKYSIDGYQGKKHYDYKVYFERVKSNLPNNKGYRWYFKCPVTGKRCSKLRLYGGYFMHLTQDVLIYDSQNRSKRWRMWDNLLGPIKLEKLEEKLSAKYAKRYYRDKPTKQYQRLLELQSKYNKQARVSLKYLNIKLTDR